MRSPLKTIAEFVPALCCAVVLVGCAQTPAAKDVNMPAETPLYAAAKGNPASAEMAQINKKDSDLYAAQIKAAPGGKQLTVDQLRTYADRCVPNAALPPPKGLDCTEIKLRMKRMFRSDDKISEALITLDRLGRSENSNSVRQDLKRGDIGLSTNAQAIAAGILDTPPPPPVPETPTKGLEDFLEQNGLAINAGVITANPG